MSTRNIYATSYVKPAHRVLMYSGCTDQRWLLIKELLMLKHSAAFGEDYFEDRFGGLWYMKVYA